MVILLVCTARGDKRTMLCKNIGDATRAVLQAYPDAAPYNGGRLWETDKATCYIVDAPVGQMVAVS